MKDFQKTNLSDILLEFFICFLFSLYYLIPNCMCMYLQEFWLKQFLKLFTPILNTLFIFLTTDSQGLAPVNRLITKMKEKT